MNSWCRCRGKHSPMTVPSSRLSAANKVERRALETEREIGDAWLVTSGINPGDRVIVEGLQKVQPGGQAVPVEAGQAPADATPAAE